MPSGKTHLRIEIVILVLGAGVLAGMTYFGKTDLWFSEREAVLSFVLGYVISSLLLTPDMDLAKSDPMNRWGVLRVLWKPYSYFFHHRGMSHNSLLGPISRVIYLGLIVSLVAAGLHYWTRVDIEIDFLKQWKDIMMKHWMWGLGAGLIIPDQIHIVADKLFKN